MEQADLSGMHWRERWEHEAQREAQKLGAETEQSLLNWVQEGDLGSYYQLWHVLGRKGTLQNSAMVLLEFLQQHPGDDDMLHRYHCADALLKIVYGNNTVPLADLRKEIQWDHAGEDMRQRKLLELREIILAKQHSN